MRIRSTKPEFWKSRRIASVDWDARLVLKGLESYVDDNGVGVDDIELIVTDVFPRDMFANPRETVARVSEAIRSLHHAGLVHRYEVNGDRLLYISFWEEVQRIDKPGKGRNPRPDGTFDYKESAIRESVASPPETLAPGTEEQGNRGTGEQGSSAPTERGDARAATTAELPVEIPEAEVVADTSPETTQTIIAAWIDACGEHRPAGRLIGQLSKEIKTLLDEGQPYGDVLAAVQLWHSKGVHPSTLPSVLHEMRHKRAPATAADRRLQAGAERHVRLVGQTTPRQDPFEAYVTKEIES